MESDDPDEAPPPNDADKSGPESRKTDETIPLNPPAALPPLVSSPSSDSPLPPPPLLPPDNDPDDPADPPRIPLLNEPNFWVIAEILGVMMPEMRAWKLGTGAGAEIPSCLFFSMLVLSN